MLDQAAETTPKAMIAATAAQLFVTDIKAS